MTLLIDMDRYPYVKADGFDDWLATVGLKDRDVVCIEPTDETLTNLRLTCLDIDGFKAATTGRVKGDGLGPIPDGVPHVTETVHVTEPLAPRWLTDRAA